ncbi:MAG: hypothetical protein O2958_10020 [Gemmatimonadetes bacterium]|nr:hypothetical protein [Gemmatimonadota bacterium]MDA1103333.1 hypothetical protein [Gemmatimonadota bacterium]
MTAAAPVRFVLVTWTVTRTVSPSTGDVSLAPTLMETSGVDTGSGVGSVGESTGLHDPMRTRRPTTAGR